MSWDNVGAAAGNWGEPAADAGGDTFTGIDAEHVSKHEGGGGYTCRNCGAEGHFSKDCEEPGGGGGGMTGECFRCGQVGHNKADCTNEPAEREFTGTCRLCNEEGHRAKDCPSAPPKVCKRCMMTGHIASECSGSYRVWSDEIEDLDPDKAYYSLLEADKTGDLDDFKKAFYAYCKSAPDMTLDGLETVLREHGARTWLIAKQQEVSVTHTIVNNQGDADQEFVVSFQYGLAPRRAKFADAWPKTEEENLERLKKAGFVRDRMVSLCSNCNELGHISKNCPEEKREIEGKPVIVCQNCKEEGHYIRDCTQPKVDRNACRNCGESGHNSKECEAPRNPATVECRVCSEMGHFSKDCPSKPQQSCFNCGQEGHRSSECTEPRKKIDWSQVTCPICSEKGHGPKRCPQGESGDQENRGFREAEAGSATGGGEGGAWDTTAGGDEGGAWETGGVDLGTAAPSGDDGWGLQEAPAKTAGGW